MPKLTALQEAFVWHLTRDPKRNTAKAARLAGYTTEPNKIGQKLFNTPHVRAAYDAIMLPLMAEHGVTPESITKEMARIAFGDRRKIVRTNGKTVTVTPSDEWTDRDASMVKEILWKDTEDGPRQLVAIKFESRSEALANLAKINGMLREKVDVSLDVRFSNAAQWFAETLEQVVGGIKEPGESADLGDGQAV